MTVRIAYIITDCSILSSNLKGHQCRDDNNHTPHLYFPAPSTPVLQTHSRSPSALGQGTPIEDGVSIPRNNVGAVKRGLSPSSFFNLLIFLIFSPNVKAQRWLLDQ